MTEKEAIKVLENHAQYTNAKVIDEETGKEYKVSEAIRKMLDLYSTEADLTQVYISGVYDGEKKWKDKIKEKIEELENNKELYFEKTIIQGRIDLLKEIIKEV